MSRAETTVADRLSVPGPIVVPQFSDPGDQSAEVAEYLPYRGRSPSVIRDVLRGQTKSRCGLLDEFRECPFLVGNDSELDEDG